MGQARSLKPAENVPTGTFSEGFTSRSKRIKRAPARLMHNFTLTTMMLQRSVAHEGTTTLVQAVVDRLNANKSISFVALGGSITNGRGVGFPSDYEGSWSKIVFNWIQKTWPDVRHTYVNGAASATDASYFASCLYRHCPKDADMIILEHAVNTAPGQKATGSMERLVRRILSR